VDPAWLPDDPAEVLRLQIERIEACTRQWAGKIDCWDVVNEAVKYDREEPKKNAPKLTEAIRRAGVPNYIRQAFVAARRGNPKAELIINDYITGAEYGTDVIEKLVDDSGRPLYDVIGIQCHQHGGAWSAQHTWDICEHFAKFGKPLHFTEATILSGKNGWGLRDKDPKFDWQSTPEGEAQQAREVVRFYRMLFSHPAVEAITWWDPSDQAAWQAAPTGWLRKDMTPKPAYDELHKLIRDKWWTRTSAVAGPGGEVRFHGFYGDYEFQTRAFGDRVLTGRFSLTKDTGAPVRVELAFLP
jgi:GH35 family endo-1,4-beta-xylanase